VLRCGDAALRVYLPDPGLAAAQARALHSRCLIYAAWDHGCTVGRLLAVFTLVLEQTSTRPHAFPGPPCSLQAPGKREDGGAEGEVDDNKFDEFMGNDAGAWVDCHAVDSKVAERVYAGHMFSV
jgi:hypothetical protein